MLIAADTNVLMDLAAEVESVVDTLGLVRQRVAGARWVVLPTVIQELRFIAKYGETGEDERLAVKALQSLTHWGLEPVNFLPVEYGITEQIALRLRRAGLLPETEINDSFILAEAALLGCGLLVSSDAHLTSLDFQRLTLELKASDVSVPAIGSPRDIVRKFYS
jgi:predicted nucleic acid-binding protein